MPMRHDSLRCRSRSCRIRCRRIRLKPLHLRTSRIILFAVVCRYLHCTGQPRDHAAKLIDKPPSTTRSNACLIHGHFPTMLTFQGNASFNSLPPVLRSRPSSNGDYGPHKATTISLFVRPIPDEHNTQNSICITQSKAKLNQLNRPPQPQPEILHLPQKAEYGQNTSSSQGKSPHELKPTSPQSSRPRTETDKLRVSVHDTQSHHMHPTRGQYCEF